MTIFEFKFEARDEDGNVLRGDTVQAAATDVEMARTIARREVAPTMIETSVRQVG